MPDNDDPNHERLQQLVAGIDPTDRRVLVTGADGYIAGVLIRLLLQHDFVVHGTFYHTTPHYLQAVCTRSDQLKLFYADLLTHSFVEPMEGCTVVFHMASPFFLSPYMNAAKDLVQPAIVGTRHVLQAASETSSVKRVVLTSSVGAMYGNASETSPRNLATEEWWNRSSTLHHQPYFYSKTLAEQTAWTMAGSQNQWTLVVLNPSLLLGPGVKYHAQSESFKTIMRLVSGCDWRMWFGCPDMAMPAVDVRDVAAAHVIAALDVDHCKGRCIVSAANSSTWQMACILRRAFPQFPVSCLSAAWIPRWLVCIVTPLLRSGVDPKTVWHNLNQQIWLDNTKSREVWQIQYRPISQTLQDMMQQLIDCGAIKPGYAPEFTGLAIIVFALFSLSIASYFREK